MFVCFNGKEIHVSAVIWDKDGTIIDVHLYWTEVIKRRAVFITKYYNLSNDYINLIESILGLDHKSGKLKPEGPVGIKSRDEILIILTDALIKKNVKCTLEENTKIFEIVHKEFLKNMYDYVKVIPFVENTLKLFKERNIKQYLLTSDSFENTEKTIKSVGLYSYFDEIHGRESFALPKYTGLPSKKLCKQNNLDPASVLCIGDSKMDYDMAINSSCNHLIVASGQNTSFTLRSFSRNVVDSLSYIEVK